MIRDAAVRALVGALAAAARRRFGERYRATYVWGSHARGDAIETSDIDVGVFVRGDDPEDVCERLADELAASVGGDPRLDFSVVADVRLDGRDGVSFRHGAFRADGEDLTASVPLPSREDWLDLAEEAALWWIGRGRRPPWRPLAAHDASDEFLGYAGRKVVLADGREVSSAKEVLSIAGRIATAHVARASGRFVGDRPQAIAAHASDVGDLDSQFLAELQESVRTRWRYLIPEAPEERARLRVLCERTLAFERAFVERLAAGPRGPRTEALWNRPITDALR